MDKSEVIANLVERLITLKPEKIILFGSQASAEAKGDSDLDMLVVTSDEIIPETFKEKSKIFLRVSKTISDIRKNYPVDLIVHTKAMHERFKQLDSLFAREIQISGKIVYEKHH
jgi:predicted nucleotidyltransferase